MPYCSVVRCKYRTTRDSSVRVFQVPRGLKPFVVNQRRLWQHAIREANGGTGTLLANPRVCAAHFLSGEASSDFESPDFVPSVFPYTQQRKTRSQDIKKYTQEIKTPGQESKRCIPKSKSQTPERKPTIRKPKTCSQENNTHLQESQTHIPESKNSTPERNTRNQESKIYCQGIMTRSQESKIRIQRRENRKRRRNWIFGSRKKRHCRTRSKLDELALNVQTSAFKKAQNEHLEEEEEEEERPLSPSVLKEGQMLPEDEETNVGKVSLHSETSSRPNVIPRLLPADITALLRHIPVVRLKRLVMPAVGFRCELCNETFPSSPLLLKHKERHEENLHFICEICGVSFTVREEFTAHQSNHPKLEPYFPCNMCDRSFPTIQQLKRHKLLHVRDGRKCLKCGTLFCQRHNHVLFRPQPRVKSESEEEAVGEESPEVKRELIEKKESPVKAEKKVQIIIPPTNRPVVTVSVIPLQGVFHERPLASPSLFHQISVKTVQTTPRPRHPATPLLISPRRPPPPLVLPPSSLLTSPRTPSLPSSLLSHSSGDTRPSIHTETEKALPLPQEPFIPDCSDFPPSLKMFSPQYLTSALMEVERNYEYIFNEPKRFKGMAKKEGSAPLSISSRKRLVEPGMRQRVAYDLEVVL